MKKALGWVSCGVTSAVACKMAIEQYGAENVILFYIGIKSAHEDNIRFLKDLERWYGIPIYTERSKEYDDQFEVIEGTGQVNSAYGAACTTHLKKRVRQRIQLRYPECVQIFGFEYGKKEINRAIRFIEQHPETNPRFPLIEEKVSKAECADILIRSGIELPAMYLLGYQNNNCIGCVKGKKGYWNKIRVDFPEVFDRMAKAEREAKHSCIKEDFYTSRDMTTKEIVEIYAALEKPNKWQLKSDGLYYDHRKQIMDLVTGYWHNKMDGRPLFLDQLNPKDGAKLKPVVPDCGSLCEIKFADILDPRTNGVFKNPLKIKELYESLLRPAN